MAQTAQIRPITESMSDKEVRAALREIVVRITPLTGVGAPVTSAKFVGQEYQDTTAVLPAGWFKASTVGNGAADWVAIS
jgi:hypothetical protein